MSFETIGHVPIMTCRKVREVKHVRKTIKASEYNQEISRILKKPRDIKAVKTILTIFIRQHEEMVNGMDDVNTRIYKHFLETGEKYIDEGTDNQAVVDF